MGSAGMAMLTVRVQPPTFFAERAIDQLVGRLPAQAVDLLRANLRAFRAWVAEPAFRCVDGDAAVQHVLAAVGPSVQLKADFLVALTSVPQGLELFLEAVTDDLVDVVPREGPAGLIEATEDLVRAQRAWFRLMVFHPDLQGLDEKIGSARLAQTLTLGFHADNLLTVSLMACDGEAGVPPATVEALAAAAQGFAARWLESVQAISEEAAPRIDADRPTTVDDLLALPPYGGKPLTIEEMDEAIAEQFKAS